MTPLHEKIQFFLTHYGGSLENVRCGWIQISPTIKMRTFKLILREGDNVEDLIAAIELYCRNYEYATHLDSTFWFKDGSWLVGLTHYYKQPKIPKELLRAEIKQ